MGSCYMVARGVESCQRDQSQHPVDDDHGYHGRPQGAFRSRAFSSERFCRQFKNPLSRTSVRKPKGFGKRTADSCHKVNKLEHSRYRRIPPYMYPSSYPSYISPTLRTYGLWAISWTILRTAVISFGLASEICGLLHLALLFLSGWPRSAVKNTGRKPRHSNYRSTQRRNRSPYRHRLTPSSN